MLYYIVGINIIGLVSMLLDKQFAKRHIWRISEIHLLLIALLGGSIGSWTGMYMFRHKTQHIKFYVGIPLIIVLQVVAIFISRGK